jgi:hypothetical protein
MIITNGIYLGDDWIIVKFFGTFDFDFQKRKLEFDFDELSLFGLRIPLVLIQTCQTHHHLPLDRLQASK